MTRSSLLFLALAAAALAGCDGALQSTGQYSTGNQRSIDADIAAVHDQGPIPENVNPAQVSILPSVTVPLGGEY